jgi:gliding-associated putative ABC transporter substrate-binding component GldG
MNFSNRSKKIMLSIVITILLVGIAFMGSFISIRHFIRVDLTQYREFKLNPSSIAVMESLDDIVTIKVFFSPDLPPNLIVVRRYVEDVLNELSSYTNGNLTVQFLDPSIESVQEEATLLGVPMVRVNVLQKDKFEVQSSSLGIVFIYGDQHEILPVVQETHNIEYDVVSTIQKLINPEIKHIGFVTGHNEYPIVTRLFGATEDSYNTVRQQLDKNYLVTTVNADKDSLEAIDTLVIAGPETPFSLSEKKAIDQFLIRGGNLIFLIDGVLVEDFLTAQPLDVNLDDLLNHYGVRVNDHLVLDRINETATFNEQGIAYILPYPFWVKAIQEYFHSNHPIVSQLDTIVLPWVSPLSLMERDKITITTLIKTSENSWLEKAPFNLNPEIDVPSAGDSHIIAALLEGSFDSFFQSTLESSKNQPGGIFIMGNSRFLADRFLKQYRKNINIFLNTVDYLTLDTNLSDIRSKVILERPLAELSDRERHVVKYLGIFFMPALVILYGFSRSVGRRRRKIKLPL